MKFIVSIIFFLALSTKALAYPRHNTTQHPSPNTECFGTAPRSQDWQNECIRITKDIPRDAHQKLYSRYPTSGEIQLPYYFKTKEDPQPTLCQARLDVIGGAIVGGVSDEEIWDAAFSVESICFDAPRGSPQSAGGFSDIGIGQVLRFTLGRAPLPFDLEVDNTES